MRKILTLYFQSNIINIDDSFVTYRKHKTSVLNIVYSNSLNPLQESSDTPGAGDQTCWLRGQTSVLKNLTSGGLGVQIFSKQRTLKVIRGDG